LKNPDQSVGIFCILAFMNVSFGQPLFLWGILSVLCPLFLHFYHKKQRAPIPFSDLRFLKTMDLRGKGFRSVRRWWLLLLRMLALIFFFLGLSEPSWQSDRRLISQSPLVIVDNHVGLIQGRRPEFLVEGKKLATQIGSISLLTLEGQEPNFPTGNWSQIRSAKNSNRYFGKSIPKGKPIIWVSDFLTSRGLPNIPQGSQVQFRRITSPETDNLRVDSLWFSDAFIRKNEAFNLQVRIKNTGTLAAKNRHLSLQMGNFTLNSGSINLAPAGMIDLTFSVSLTQDEVQAKLISNDPCEFDNTFYFIMRPSKIRQVFRVSSTANVDVLGSVFQNDGLFLYRKIHPNTFLLENTRLSGFAIVEGFEGWSEEAWKSLSTWVKQGNGLVLIPKNQEEKMMANRLNQLLANQNTSFRPANEKLPIPIRKPDKKLQFFAGIVQAKSFAEVWEMFSTKALLTWQGGTSLFEYVNTAPFLSQFSVGNGRFFVFSSAMEQEFVQHGLFLPVFQEMALTSVQETAAFFRWEKSGFKIPGASPKGDEVLNFEKEQVWIPEQTWNDGQWHCEWPNTIGANFPGFYQVKLAGKPMGTMAVNYPKSVSERTSFSDERLRTHFSNASFPDDWDLNLGLWQGENGLVRLCFLLSLLCFLVEMLLLFLRPS
jgi:hypothetical protein